MRQISFIFILLFSCVTLSQNTGDWIGAMKEDKEANGPFPKYHLNSNDYNQGLDDDYDENRLDFHTCTGAVFFIKQSFSSDSCEKAKLQAKKKAQKRCDITYRYATRDGGWECLSSKKNGRRGFSAKACFVCK